MCEYKILLQSVGWESGCFIQTYITKLIVCFHNFANVLKKTLINNKCFQSFRCFDVPGFMVTWRLAFVNPCCSMLHVDGCRRLTKPLRTFTDWWTFQRSFLFQKLWQTTTKSWLWCSGKLVTTCSMLLLYSSCSSCQKRWRRTLHLRNYRGEGNGLYFACQLTWHWLEA